MIVANKPAEKTAFSTNARYGGTKIKKRTQLMSFLIETSNVFT